MASVLVDGRPYYDEGMVSETSGSESEEFLNDPKARSIRAAWRAKWTGARTRSEDKRKVTPPKLNYIERENWRETQFDISPSALPTHDSSPYPALSAPARTSFSGKPRVDNGRLYSKNNPREGKRLNHDSIYKKESPSRSRRRKLNHQNEEQNLHRQLMLTQTRITPTQIVALRDEEDMNLITSALFNQNYGVKYEQKYDPMNFSSDDNDVNMQHSSTWPALSGQIFASPLQANQSSSLRYHHTEPIFSNATQRRRGLGDWLGGCCNKSQCDERCY
mmetsp:Transcript_22350/g.28916  ORF Transcript_22350/g.28916 Transcript_22350/m.28916 type:complete len:276 (-) Transcript_22350:3708-4535(-)